MMMITRPTRSDFVLKLHDLLDHPLDPSALRWVSDDTFEITCNEARARYALSAKWDFRSLSSFIRQLSYYSFRRLSDRRRSNERRAKNTGFIVFTHPSGYFIRGNNSQVHAITRKARNRGPPQRVTNRRTSTTSTQSGGSYEPDSPPEMPSPWPAVATQYTAPIQYAPHDERKMLTHQPLPGFQPTFVPTADLAPAPPGYEWRPQSSYAWSEEKQGYVVDHQAMVPRRTSDLGAPPSYRSKGSEPPRRFSVPTLSLPHPHDDYRAAYPSPSMPSPLYSTTPPSSSGLLISFSNDGHQPHPHEKYLNPAEVLLPSPTASHRASPYESEAVNPATWAPPPLHSPRTAAAQPPRQLSQPISPKTQEPRLAPMMSEKQAQANNNTRFAHLLQPSPQPHSPHLNWVESPQPYLHAQG